MIVKYIESRNLICKNKFKNEFSSHNTIILKIGQFNNVTGQHLFMIGKYEFTFNIYYINRKDNISNDGKILAINVIQCQVQYERKMYSLNGVLRTTFQVTRKEF